MGGVLGKNDTHLSPQQKELIQKLQQQKKKLKDRQRQIKTCIQRDRQIARNLVKRKQKEKAKEILKQKCYEQSVFHTTCMLINDIIELCDLARNSEHVPDISQHLKEYDDVIKKVDVCFSNDSHKVFDLVECYHFTPDVGNAICRELDSMVVESSHFSGHYGGHASHGNGSHHHDSGGGWDSGGDGIGGGGDSGGGGGDSGGCADSGGGGGDSGGGSID